MRAFTWSKKDNHTYDEAKAREVYGVLDAFAADAAALLARLQGRHA